MAPFLVILGLLLLGVAIVAWHTREIWWHAVAHLLPQPPLTRAGKAAIEPGPEPAVPAEPDAFTHAPASRSFIADAPAVAPAPVSAPVSANDPFAHAPAVSDLSDRALPQSETRH